MTGNGAGPAGTAGFGDSLRQFRLRQGLSQEQLARRISYSRPHLANLERGALLPGRGFLPRIEAEFPGGGAALQAPYLAARREQRRTRLQHAVSAALDGAPGAPDLGGEVEAALEAHGTVSLAGTWYALWETTAEGRPSIDSEAVTVEQHGPSLSISRASHRSPSPRSAPASPSAWARSPSFSSPSSSTGRPGSQVSRSA